MSEETGTSGRSQTLEGGFEKTHSTDRTQEEKIPVEPSTIENKVVAPPENSNSSPVEGSIAASQPTFKNMWISRQEYDKYGPSIVHRKCF